METIALEGKLRETANSKEAKNSRREDIIPCVLYGPEMDNLHFKVPRLALKDLIFTPKFHKINIKVDGKEYDAIIKEIQFHPVNDKVVHVDFIQLTAGKKVKTEIPVKLIGQAPGVREGGSLILKTRKLKVKVLPKNLKEDIEVSVDGLGMGQVVKVQDIDVEGIEILTLPSVPIVGVVVPRTLKTAEEEAAELEAEATEEGGGETLAEKKEEGGEKQSEEKSDTE